MISFVMLLHIPAHGDELGGGGWICERTREKIRRLLKLDGADRETDRYLE